MERLHLVLKYLKTYRRREFHEHKQYIYITKLLKRAPKGKIKRKVELVMEEDKFPIIMTPSRKDIKETIEEIKKGTPPQIDKINVKLKVAAPAKIYEIIEEIMGPTINYAKSAILIRNPFQ